MTDHWIQGTKNAEDAASPQTDGLQMQAANDPAGRLTRVLRPGQALPEAKRLIVLIPDVELAQDAKLPQRIWQLASPGRVPVVYLAIAADYVAEMSARRRLTLLAAVTRDKRVPVEIYIAHASSWVGALRPFCQDGDIILGHACQTVRKGLFGSEPLCDQLGRNLTAPIFLLSEYVQGVSKSTSQPLRIFYSVAVLGLILLGFFVLDAQVIDQLRGTFQRVMLVILLCMEIGAIWVWNGLTG